MRSRTSGIVSDRQVQALAEAWLREALPLEDVGGKCTARVLWQIVMLAAARMVSLFAACRDLAGAPGDDAVREALVRCLPKRPRTKTLLLDRRFFMLDVLASLQACNVPFVIPLVLRGKKPKRKKAQAGLRAKRRPIQLRDFPRQAAGRYAFTSSSDRSRRISHVSRSCARSTSVRLCLRISRNQATSSASVVARN